MTIKEVADIITKKKYVFEVSIPNTNFFHGKQTIDKALLDNDSLESYLERIARLNKASNLLIKTYTPNGTSYRFRNDYLIFLLQTEPVATTATNVATTATNVATRATNSVATTKKALNGTHETPINTQNNNTRPIFLQQPKPVTTTATNVATTATNVATTQKSTTMDTKDYIEFRVLQGEHRRLEDSASEAKTKIAKLEKKIEELHEENKKLLRDNLTKEDKHEVALEKVKLQMEREGKDSLSGIVGELTKDPDTLKMIIGFLKPDHPIFKEQEQKALGAAKEPTEIKYTEDTEVNSVLNDIPRSLSQKDGKTIAEIYLLFQEFITKPETLKLATTTFLPNLNA